MKILAFDTAVMGCSVAVYDSGSGEVWQDRIETDRRQAEILVPMIRDVMLKANVTFTEIGLIAVTKGPGSFTGVRIGLATARALALASGCKLAGVSTFDLLAAQAGVKPDEDVLVVIDTKREDFYGQRFGPKAEAGRIWSQDDVKSSGARIIDLIPDSVTLARLAETLPAQEAYPDPVYLRGAEVSQSRRVAPVAVD